MDYCVCVRGMRRVGVGEGGRGGSKVYVGPA